MTQVKNGSDIDSAHAGQIAHSQDGIKWSYFSKQKVKNIRGKDMTVRLMFDDNTSFDIDLSKVTNQPTWLFLSDGAGLTNAISDLSKWINEPIDAITKLLQDLKKYQNGSKGFKIIQPADGQVNGHWYLVRPIEHSTFTKLIDGASDLVITMPLAGVVIPAGTSLTTSNLDTLGFQSIQVAVGKVIAYIL